MSVSRRRNRRSRQQPDIPWLTAPFRTLKSPLEPVNWANEEKIEKLHDASMWILENVGMAFMDAEALDLWEHAGARVDRTEERVWIDRGLVMELVAKAPSEFTWHARNPARNLTIGGKTHRFYTEFGDAIRIRFGRWPTAWHLG